MYKERCINIRDCSEKHFQRRNKDGKRFIFHFVSLDIKSIISNISAKEISPINCAFYIKRFHSQEVNASSFSIQNETRKKCSKLFSWKIGSTVHWVRMVWNRIAWDVLKMKIDLMSVPNIQTHYTNTLGNINTVYVHVSNEHRFKWDQFAYKYLICERRRSGKKFNLFCVLWRVWKYRKRKREQKNQLIRDWYS